jgi:hypothetical protein
MSRNWLYTARCIAKLQGETPKGQKRLSYDDYSWRCTVSLSRRIDLEARNSESFTDVGFRVEARKEQREEGKSRGLAGVGSVLVGGGGSVYLAR